MEYLDLTDLIAANEEQLRYWMLEYVNLVGTTTFTELRTLQVSIDTACISKLLFIFQLPSLEVAHISIITPHEAPHEAFPVLRTADWKKTQSPIKKLSFTNMTMTMFFWVNFRVYRLFALIGGACPSLEFFKLSSSGRDQCLYSHVYEGVTKALSHNLTSGSLRHFELWSDIDSGHICRQPYPDITEIWKSDGVQVEVLIMDMVMLFRDSPSAPMMYPDPVDPVDSAIPRSIQHLTLRHNPARYTQSKEDIFVKRSLFHLLDRIRKCNSLPELRTVTLEMPERIFQDSLQDGMLVSLKNMMQDAYLLEKVRLQFRSI
ncbi:hypothetical protein K505DRAFT_361531 [Melanomma pulvis-pyrius CBS 109.77]|uniref:Uncharacterized protein n=1 Tax=Melanomma pulvis-pyrius CBS 109.77 TaxID=1314802 RepID=A0A6A6XBZ3_9PLEO|nr:hypothetical protein K505DRAFT_361531 [Melanomma pulvis-pyrius CBS 109.77]